MKRYSAILLNILILIAGFFGLCFTINGGGFMKSGTFLYYTVQSNLLTLCSACIMLVFETRRIKGHAIPASVNHFRLFSCISISLTFTVFVFVLAPQLFMTGYAHYLKSPGNLFVHNLIPLLSILDWYLYGSTKTLKRGAPFSGTVSAIAYIFFAYWCVGQGLTFTGKTFPYFFLDYETYGWFRMDHGLGVVYWILIIAAVVIGLGFLLRSIVKRREARQLAKKVSAAV